MANSLGIDPHIHDHMFLGASHDKNARRTLWVVALTAIMMVGEIIAGYVTGSMALLADGFHMATHAGALTIAAAAYSYAKRHAADRRFSFGTGKVGDLAGFASALVLGLVALGIGGQSILRLYQPIHVAFGEATVVAIIGLGVNIASAFLLAGSHSHGHAHPHDHHHHHDHGHQGAQDHTVGVKSRDNNLRSAYFHVLADALTSVLAIAALLAGSYLGWIWLDPVMGIVGAVVIARWSWSLMRDTAAVLLDTTDEHIADEVRELLAGPTGARITDLHIWRVGPEAHAGIVSVADGPGIDQESIRRCLQPVHELAHLTVEIR